MMVMDHRQQHMESVRSVLTTAIYPIQYLINLPSGVGEWLSESLSSRQTLIDQNNSLRAQQFLYATQLQKLDSIAAENMRLRALLDSSIDVSDKILIAELLSVDMKPFTQQVVISKGSRHDVYRGQPILDASGILGQVVHVTPFNSTSMLITDPSHALPVQVNRSGQRAIAMGTGETNRLELPHLPNNADIEVGDLLVTSGLGGRFPPGYPAARVTMVTRNPGQPFAEVQAEPTGKLESAREVLLVWHNPPGANPGANPGTSPEANNDAPDTDPDAVQDDAGEATP